MQMLKQAFSWNGAIILFHLFIIFSIFYLKLSSFTAVHSLVLIKLFSTISEIYAANHVTTQLAPYYSFILLFFLSSLLLLLYNNYGYNHSNDYHHIHYRTCVQQEKNNKKKGVTLVSISVNMKSMAANSVTKTRLYLKLAFRKDTCIVLYCIVLYCT